MKKLTDLCKTVATGLDPYLKLIYKLDKVGKIACTISFEKCAYMWFLKIKQSSLLIWEFSQQVYSIVFNYDNRNCFVSFVHWPLFFWEIKSVKYQISFETYLLVSGILVACAITLIRPDFFPVEDTVTIKFAAVSQPWVKSS